MSEVVTYQTIKKDLQTVKSEIFIQEFPQVKDEINTFKAKPNCGACELNVLPKIFSDPKLEQKLKLIYGNDIQVDKTLPQQQQPQWHQSVEIFDFTAEEFDQRMTEYLTNFDQTRSHITGKIIRQFNFAFNPTSNTYKVVSQVMKKTD